MCNKGKTDDACFIIARHHTWRQSRLARCFESVARRLRLLRGHHQPAEGRQKAGRHSWNTTTTTNQKIQLNKKQSWEGVRLM